MNIVYRDWFTLVELMVWVVVIAVLWSIAFVSFVWNIWTSRDAVRLDNFAKIQLYLTSYKEKHWVYPIPTQWFNITNNWRTVAIQGKLNQEFLLDSFDSVPVDPSTKKPYPYSILKNRSAYQIAATLEDSTRLTSLVTWDYTSVSVNVLPSIIMALNPGAGVDIEINQSLPEWVTNGRAFLFNNNSDNLPYTLDWVAAPKVWTLSLPQLITSSELDDYWQNIDYKNCQEISDAWRYIWDWEYQILQHGFLINTTCTLDSLLVPITSCISDIQATNLNNSFWKNWSNQDWCSVTDLELDGELLSSSLPDELWLLTWLTTLDISGNSITEIPVWIWSLVNLAILDVTGNSLTSIPSEIWNLVKLEHALFKQNNLVSLPTELSLLTELKTLNLVSNNSLWSLKHYFKHDSWPQSKTEWWMTISRDGSNVIVTGVF